LNLALLHECRERTEQALDSLAPDADLSDRLRMQLHLEHGVALAFTMGFVERAATDLGKAIEIAEALDDANAQMRALWALWVLRSFTGEFRTAQSTAKQFSHIARRVDDQAAVLFSDRLMGVVLQVEGKQREARLHLERVLEHYVLPKTPGHIVWGNYDSRVLTRAMLARALWVQGLVEHATTQAKVSFEQAEAARNVFSCCEVLRLAVCPIALMTGDFVGAEQALTMQIDLATRYNSPVHTMWARGLEGTFLIKRGAFASGLTRIRAVLDACEKTGWAMWRPEWLGMLAEGLAGLGQRAEALAATDQALATADRGGECWYVPELLRIKGDLLVQEAEARSVSAAEDCFHQALGVSQQQGALFWELRAATSLARLRMRQGRQRDARLALAPVYAKFTEGFGTMDLRAARALLETL
jgi:tetratricopeptide (TPR) repeat protein